MTPAQILSALAQALSVYGQLLHQLPGWAIALVVIVVLVALLTTRLVGLVKHAPGVINARDRARLSKILARRIKRCDDADLERLVHLYLCAQRANHNMPDAESTDPKTEPPPPAPPPQPDELT